MKQRNIHILLLSFLLASLLAACSKNEMATFDPNSSYVRFELANNLVYEDREKPYEIAVEASGIVEGVLTVGFEFYVSDEIEGMTIAEEGKDFTVLNSSRILHFEKGVGRDVIRIQMVDDDLKNSNRTIAIRLVNPNPKVDVGFEGTRDHTRLVVVDDESQSKYSGIWEVTAFSAYYQASGSVKATADTSANFTQPIKVHEVVITVHPTEAGVLQVTNFMGNSFMTANLIIDEEDGTATMPYMQLGITPDDNKDPVHLYGFDSEGEDTGSDPIVGKIVNASTLKFYRYQAVATPSNGGQIYAWGWQGVVLKATWVKQ